MKLLIGITTAPRPESYLAQLINRLWTQEVEYEIVLAPTVPSEVAVKPWDGKVLCVGPAGETKCRMMPPLFDVEYNQGERAARGALELNTDRLIRLLASESEIFITLQDDGMPCRRALERMHQIAVWMKERPNVAWVSFYTPWEEAAWWPHALWPYPQGKFYGEVAMMWNRGAAQAFLAESNPSIAHDLMIQRFFKRPPWRFYGHSPCLFQHVGFQSATGKSWEGQRTTMNFRPSHDPIKDAKPLVGQ